MRTIADKYIDEGVQKEMVQGMQIGEAKGMQIDKAEGKTEGKYEVAKNMLAVGSDSDFIAKVTGLAIDEINKLKNS